MQKQPSSSPGPSRTRSTGRATSSPKLTASTRIPPRSAQLRLKPALYSDGGGSPGIRSPAASHSPDHERPSSRLAQIDSTAAAVAAALKDLSEFAREQSPTPMRLSAPSSPIKSPTAFAYRGHNDTNSVPGSNAASCVLPVGGGSSNRSHAITTVGGPVSCQSHRGKDSLRSSRSQPAYAFSRMFSAPSRSVLPTPLTAAESASALNTSLGGGTMSPPSPAPTGSPAASPIRQRVATMQVNSQQMTRRTVGKPIRRPTHSSKAIRMPGSGGGGSATAPAYDGRLSPPAHASHGSSPALRSASPTPGEQEVLSNRRAWGARDAFARDAFVRSAWKRDSSQESRQCPTPLVSRRKHTRSNSPTLPGGRALLTGAGTAVVRVPTPDHHSDHHHLYHADDATCSMAQLAGSLRSSCSREAQSPMGRPLVFSDGFAPRRNSNPGLGALSPGVLSGSVTAAPTTSSPALSVELPPARTAGSSTAAPSSAGADAAAAIEVQAFPHSLKKTLDSTMALLDSAKRRQSKVSQLDDMRMSSGKRRHSNSSSANMTSSPRMEMIMGMYESGSSIDLGHSASVPQMATFAYGSMGFEYTTASNFTYDRALAKAGARLFVTALRAFSMPAVDDEEQVSEILAHPVADAVGKDSHLRTGCRSPILAKVIVSPYGVLGTQVSRTGQTRVNAPEPGLDVAIVDSVSMLALQSGPGRGDKESNITYSWLGYHKDQAYPPAAGQAMRGPSDAKFIVYEGKCVCIHVVEPNFTDEPCSRDAAISQLASAYRKVLSEFVASGAGTLRLLPVSGAGLSAGAFYDQFPELTAEALDKGFARLRVEEQIKVLTADRIEICIFMEKDLEAYEKAWEASGILPTFSDNNLVDVAAMMPRQTSADSRMVPIRSFENANVEASPGSRTRPLQNGISHEATVHMPPPKGKEMDSGELDEFFADLAEFSPQLSQAALGGDEASVKKAQIVSQLENALRSRADITTEVSVIQNEETESSLGGWTSEGDDEVYAIHGPLCGRRRPLNFRPGVPLLRLPPPGWGTPGSPYDEAAAAAAQAAGGVAAPRNSGAAAAVPTKWDLLHQAYTLQEPGRTPPSSVVLVPGMAAPPPPTNAAMRPARASAPASHNSRGTSSLHKPPGYGAASMIDPVLAHVW